LGLAVVARLKDNLPELFAAALGLKSETAPTLAWRGL
jgi:hypothetical protein